MTMWDLLRKKRAASITELGETAYQKEKGLSDLVAIMSVLWWSWHCFPSRNYWKSKKPLYSKV